MRLLHIQIQKSALNLLQYSNMKPTFLEPSQTSSCEGLFKKFLICIMHLLFCPIENHKQDVSMFSVLWSDQASWDLSGSGVNSSARKVSLLKGLFNLTLLFLFSGFTSCFVFQNVSKVTFKIKNHQISTSICFL